MPDYKQMYFDLFNAVTSASKILQQAQQDGEEAYVHDPILLSVVDQASNSEEQSCQSTP